MKKHFSQLFINLFLIFTVFISITACMIIFKLNFFTVLPLYVSLIVGTLQSSANRYSLLLGGFNSLLYAVVLYSFGLYANSAYSLLVSFPIQIVTFIFWSKKTYHNSTKFRKLSGKQWILTGSLFAVSFVIIHILLSFGGSQYAFLDNSSTLFGMASSILMMFACIEYVGFNLVSVALMIIMYAVMIAESPQQTTYLIFSVYSLICTMRAFFSVRRFYNEQQMV